jgi:hypothetical protein
MDSKKFRLNEFCKVGNLENFRETLESILNKIDESLCNISTREDGGPSVHEFPDISGTCRIRIPLKKFAERPLEAIWVILNEFGHHLSYTINKSELNDKIRMEREKLAWKHARELAMIYSELEEHISDFDKYSEKCLDSYRTKLHCS